MPEPLADFSGAIVRQSEARVPVESPTVKYGAVVFEGIRACLNTGRNNLLLFRMNEHLEKPGPIPCLSD